MTSTFRKKLIEVALPLEAINKASVRESYIYKGNPSSIHKWWAQRPLAAARAVIFSSLVDDPNNPDAPSQFVEACRKLPRGKNAAENDTPRQRLFDFIDTLVQWESTTDEDILEVASKLIRLATNDDPPSLLDPFAGGGTIPIEAQRLGLTPYASDLNPVAVLINKSLLEIPPRFAGMTPVNPRDHQTKMSFWSGAQGLASDIKYYGEFLRDQAWEHIGQLFPKGPNGETVIAWIWARTAECPNPACGVQMPLVRRFDLSTRKGQRAWAEPIFDKSKRQISFQVRHDKRKAPKATISGKGARCIVCNTAVSLEHIRSEGQSGRLGAQLMAIVTISNTGRNYYSPDERHTEIAAQARPNWKPDYELSTHPQYMSAPRYGLTTFADLFTPRQLVALTTFGDLLDKVQNRVYSDAQQAGLPDGIALRDGGNGALAYSQAIAVYIAFAIDKHAPYGNSLVPWYARESRPSWLFGRQSISMIWDYTEVNPFSEIGGSLTRSIDIVADAVEPLGKGKPGKVLQLDASRELATDSALISTDPPYYDNVPYADLADFFYVWLRYMLKDIFPSLHATLLVPKEQELVADRYRYGSKEEADRHFEEGMFRAFWLMRKATASDYPLTVYYAFKQTEKKRGITNSENGSSGWETMLEGLVQSEFRIVGTWPIRTERSGRLRDSGSNALASSVILVCRPRPESANLISRREFVNVLRRELPPALREMQSGNIAPVDLAQASIGPGMAVYSRYSKVLEPNGDRLTVRTALQLINHELDAYLAEQEGYIDADSRFAVAWFEQYGFDAGPFGQADVLARAKNTSVEGLAHAGVLESGAGKVRLLRWDELDPGWDPATDERLAVWEAVHHLVERLNTHGEEGAARLLAKMPASLAAEARQLAYRLYSICERKGWAEHARDYNALVISWGASQEQAREFKEQYQQERLL